MAEVWLAEHVINRRKAAITLLVRPPIDDADAEALGVAHPRVAQGDYLRETHDFVVDGDSFLDSYRRDIAEEERP